MSLQLLRTEPATAFATWRIETPTVGVVLIDVVIGGSQTAVPLHWRVGTWMKPPLDVALDGEGRLVGFQFVLQDERVDRATWSMLPDLESTVPVFNVENWPPDRYRDETLSVNARRLAGGELALRVGDERPLARAFDLAPRLVLAFGADGALAEMRLGPLPNDDWEAIDAFSLGE